MKRNQCNETSRPGRIETAANFARACANCCERIANRLNQAKDALLIEARHRFAAPERLAKLAVNEAESLAWEAGYPHLLFPTLAQEKLQAVATWNRRQREMLRGSSIMSLSA